MTKLFLVDILVSEIKDAQSEISKLRGINKLMKNKKSIFSAVMSFCILILLFTFALIIAIPFLSIKPKAETYMECTDEEYYSETTYYLTEKSYKKHLKETANESNRKNAAKAKTSSDGEFVIAATKTLNVYEMSDKDGNIIESYLLSKTEKEERLIKKSFDDNNANSMYGFSNKYDPIKDLEGGGLPETTVGKDKESLYYLTIELKVTYNAETGLYKVDGTSNWENKYTDNKALSPESTSFDYIGLTWGGNGALCVNNDLTYGKYYNDGGEIAFSKRISDSYRGYVWQFNEKNSIYPMHFAYTTVYLRKTGENQKKETNAKMTYIHTYKKISGSVSLQIGTNGVAAGISFSTTENNWQIEIDVPKITY